jgi:hypothetical protein
MMIYTPGSTPQVCRPPVSAASCAHPAGILMRKNQMIHALTRITIIAPIAGITDDKEQDVGFSGDTSELIEYIYENDL